MARTRLIRLVGILFLFTSFALCEQIPVRHAEGLVHGILVLRSAETNEVLAEGELIQTSSGDRVTSELAFHFKDGSLNQETAVFSERGKFRLVSDHLIQKGPSFKRQMEMTVDGRTGEVDVRYTEDGEEKSVSERLKLPPDVANGFIFTLLKNVDVKTTTNLSMVAATPKPRLVKLIITPVGEDGFSLAGGEKKATNYDIKVEIGGVAGWLAPILGKEPPDIHVWVLQSKAPAFIKSEGPLYAGGPIWRIELASPQYPKEAIAK